MLALVAAAIAGGFVDVGDLSFESSATSAVADAQAALAEGRYVEAAAAYAAIADAGGSVAARVAQAIALYEAGEMRLARTVAEQAITKDPKNAVGLNVLGVAMVDSGAVEDGIRRLQAARDLATGSFRARILVNLGLAYYDRGDAAAATASIDEAKHLAAGDMDLLAAINDATSTVASLSGRDGGVGQLLGTGNVRGARTEAQNAVAAAKSHRDRVNAAIQLAAVERSEGSLEASNKRLGEAVKEAREAGMMREVAVGLGNMGIASSLAGRLPLAADTLRASVTEAKKGGYRVVEADVRCELGLVLIRMGDLSGAEAEQRAAGALLAAMDYPQGVARQGELGGEIAAAKGDITTADQALSRAVAWHEGLGRALDAARVATSLAAVWERHDEAKAARWASRAESYFVKAGDALGAAHVAMARALADARGEDLEAALVGFARTVELAEKVGGERAANVARVARENAAATLVMLGHDADVAKLAAKQGVSDLIERQQKMKSAFEAYDQGLIAYEAREWERARTHFEASRGTFEVLAEPGYALRARRAAAWALYNHTVGRPVAEAAPVWAKLVEETTKVEDPELYLRTYAAAALAVHALGQGDPTARLEECTRIAERQGVADVGARCHGALAERTGDIDVRAKHARAAHALDPADKSSVYALYAVAVDAWNADRAELAVELATLARPNAGTLASAIDELLQAARGR